MTATDTTRTLEQTPASINPDQARAMIARYFGQSHAADAGEICGFFTESLITGAARFCDYCTFPVIGDLECPVCAVLAVYFDDSGSRRAEDMDEEDVQEMTAALEPFAIMETHLRMLQAARMSYGRKIYRAQQSALHAAETVGLSLLSQPYIKNWPDGSILPATEGNEATGPQYEIEGGF